MKVVIFLKLPPFTACICLGGGFRATTRHIPDGVEISPYEQQRPHVAVRSWALQGCSRGGSGMCRRALICKSGRLVHFLFFYASDWHLRSNLPPLCSVSAFTKCRLRISWYTFVEVWGLYVTGGLEHAVWPVLSFSFLRIKKPASVTHGESKGQRGRRRKRVQEVLCGGA